MVLPFADLMAAGSTLKWDLGSLEKQRRVFEVLEDLDVYWDHVCPPCTWWSVARTHPYKDLTVEAAKEIDGIVHVEFACSCLRVQKRRERVGLLEQPWSARSLRRACVLALFDAGFLKVKSQGCMFGLVHKETGERIAKALALVSNASQVQTYMGRECSKDHVHTELEWQHVKGSKVYGDEWCRGTAACVCDAGEAAGVLKASGKGSAACSLCSGSDGRYACPAAGCLRCAATVARRWWSSATAAGCTCASSAPESRSRSPP